MRETKALVVGGPRFGVPVLLAAAASESFFFLENQQRTH